MGEYFSMKDLLKVPEDFNNSTCSDEEKKEIEEKISAYFEAQCERAKKRVKAKKKIDIEIISVTTNEENHQVKICFKPRG